VDFKPALIRTGHSGQLYSEVEGYLLLQVHVMCLDECPEQVQILIKVFSMVYIGRTLTLLTILNVETPVRVVIDVLSSTSIDIAPRFLSMFIGYEPLFFLLLLLFP
jgi:hypothetical protein